MNENLWEDPNLFYPERFLKPDGSIDKVKAEIVRLVFLPGETFYSIFK